MHKVFTEFNEKLFESTTNVTNITKSGEVESKKNFIVLFRGKYNEEAGLDCILTAAEILKDEPIEFIIHTDSRLNVDYSLPNLHVFVEKLSERQMTELYAKADICLGQISANSRLKRTIPHKAFEALYFSKCYLTLATKPILELLPEENQRATVSNSSPELLVAAIRDLASDQSLVDKIGQEGKLRYEKVSSQEILGDQFLQICIN